MKNAGRAENVNHKAGWAGTLGVLGAVALTGCGSGTGSNTTTPSGGTGPQSKPQTALVFETPKPGAPLPKWTPDAARADLLDVAHPLAEGLSASEKALLKSSGAKSLSYTLRIPPNFKIQEVASSLVAPVFTIQPAQQTADAETSLVVSLQTTSGTLPTPQARLQELVKQTSPDVPLTYLPVTFGTINGRKFVRVEGASRTEQDAHRFRNFIYVTVDAANKRTIAITGSDVEPSASKTLPLLEAAVRTFQ